VSPLRGQTLSQTPITELSKFNQSFRTVVGMRPMRYTNPGNETQQYKNQIVIEIAERSGVLVLSHIHCLLFFFFLNCQFVTRGSVAVRGIYTRYLLK